LFCFSRDQYFNRVAKGTLLSFNSFILLNSLYNLVILSLD